MRVYVSTPTGELKDAMLHNPGNLYFIYPNIKGEKLPLVCPITPDGWTDYIVNGPDGWKKMNDADLFQR